MSVTLLKNQIKQRNFIMSLNIHYKESIAGKVYLKLEYRMDGKILIFMAIIQLKSKIHSYMFLILIQINHFYLNLSLMMKLQDLIISMYKVLYCTLQIRENVG